MSRKFKLYGEFEKVTDNEDGTLTVSGIASSEAVDSDGETITAEAMKAAIPDYMAFGALREMHTAWAAGTAIKCEVGADNRTYFEALVVDAEACKKVQTGTYKGFSIGGKVTGRDPLKKSTITGIKLIEVSLVDRPANPEAVFSMGKVEGDEPEATLGSLRKGLWTVADFAGVLQSLAWMAQGTEDEAEYEGDASPIPAAFGQWVADGLALLQAMTAEECAELMACLPKAPADVLAMAAKASKPEGVEGLAKADGGQIPDGWGDIQKAAFIPLWKEFVAFNANNLAKKGAKFSKATAEALANVHNMIGDCHKAMADLGFNKPSNVEEDEEDADKAAKTDGLMKAAADDLAKVTNELTLTKATNETLTKRVAELEALPEATKAVSVVFDPDKQSEMFQKQVADEKAVDLKKYQSTTDPQERYLASLKFVHKYGHKPE